MAFTTEFKFTLPKGYVDKSGTLHKNGKMRLSTAADEILPLRDPRVQQNPGYLSVILLARVVSELGSMTSIDTTIIEGLFSSDFAYLQSFYREINEIDKIMARGICPECNKEIALEVSILREQIPE